MVVRTVFQEPAQSVLQDQGAEPDETAWEGLEQPEGPSSDLTNFPHYALIIMSF